MYNILKEPIVRVRLGDKKIYNRTLPQLYVDLLQDAIIEFPALRPHQKMAWHAFLVQLAALALHNTKIDTLPSTEQEWVVVLRSLTTQWLDDEPWSLIIEDYTVPALLQPPIPVNDLKSFKKKDITRKKTADSLDILVTAKNHDIKAERLFNAQPDDWLFALLSLQTQQGYSGRDNYGISRMNSGSGNRPYVGVAPMGGFGSRFKRDVIAALKSRSLIQESYGFCQNSGLGLLWLTPWDGNTQSSLDQLDPFYIEICRRVRLVQTANRFEALCETSKKSRIDAKDRKGAVGDLWTPITSGKEQKSLTVGSSGFNYMLASEILFGRGNRNCYHSAPLQNLQPNESDEGATIHFFAMARGNCITEGLHERFVPIPKKCALLFQSSNEKNRLADCAKERVQQADKMRQKVLGKALAVLIQQGNAKLESETTKTISAGILRRFDEIVDHRFFEDLWLEIEAEPQHREKIKRQWLLDLYKEAYHLLAMAADSLPKSSISCYRARARADQQFYARFYNSFPNLKENLKDAE